MSALGLKEKEEPEDGLEWGIAGMELLEVMDEVKNESAYVQCSCRAGSPGAVPNSGACLVVGDVQMRNKQVREGQRRGAHPSSPPHEKVPRLSVFYGGFWSCLGRRRGRGRGVGCQNQSLPGCDPGRDLARSATTRGPVSPSFPHHTTGPFSLSFPHPGPPGHSLGCESATSGRVIMIIHATSNYVRDGVYAMSKCQTQVAEVKNLPCLPTYYYVVLLGSVARRSPGSPVSASADAHPGVPPGQPSSNLFLSA